jgi:predicted transposase YdaD
MVAFGQEINANHLRSVRDGILTATATPLHAGRTSQVWQILIHDERERLICVSRCTLAVVPRSRESATEERRISLAETQRTQNSNLKNLCALCVSARANC